MKTTSKTHINKQERNVGIDVGKTYLDIYILEIDRHWQIHNHAEPKNVIAVRKLQGVYKLPINA